MGLRVMWWRGTPSRTRPFGDYPWTTLTTTPYWRTMWSSTSNPRTLSEYTSRQPGGTGSTTTTFAITRSSSFQPLYQATSQGTRGTMVSQAPRVTSGATTRAWTMEATGGSSGTVSVTR